MQHLPSDISATSPGTPTCNCDAVPDHSLVTMFVDMVQKGRIQAGQCPARRPVFLKPHAVAHGTFRINDDIPEVFKVGLFAGTEYPVWARFSSDTLPTRSDYGTTVGIALKLFNTPTPKIFGQPDDTTSDIVMQNMDVFFVDTARDMCEFTKAGVIDGDYTPYLDAHPRTKEILDAMAKPVGSALATPYWAILPFSLGEDHFVKYKLEPTIEVPSPPSPPRNPCYLAAEIAERISGQDIVFRFCLQLRTNSATMPLDEATVPWPETESPFVHVADLIFPRQDVNERGQAAYGENLSWNIWRVTSDHTPQGSIAGARKVVYEASANERRNVNGTPDGEPAQPRPAGDVPPGKDTFVVRASIHPAIGVARVGDADTEFFIGPEVVHPAPGENSGKYRTPAGKLKRQAARFRLYGYNAAGEVVRELTPEDADIQWRVHVANRKADWFRFITAMDIPETKNLTVPRRNAAITGPDRAQLVIDPGPRSISGLNVSGGADHRFDTGTFKGVPVPLGELQTDAQGRLLFLGGHGKSASPGGEPPFNPADPDTFNNADDWYDDISDGPVDATVSIDGRAIPVEGAWVLCAPPNYAPDVIGWRTLYDLLVDAFTSAGTLPLPGVTSFTKDIYPLLGRLSNLQWVNKGFAAMYGKGRPMDFDDPALIARLAQSDQDGEPYAELRRVILNTFRAFDTPVNEPRLWPWIYGDDFGGDLQAVTPNTMLALPQLQQLHLQRWVNGSFINDWQPGDMPPRKLSEVPLPQQPDMLDQAALHFCLADAFHPGCETTWPMRHASLYEKPFRIRRGESTPPAGEYGPTLDQQQALAVTGPLYAQSPGDITCWMGLPWQGDTAYCRSGYDPQYDPYLPTFWAARVPNWVLTEEDYQTVIDESVPREDRIAAYNRRAYWFRSIDQAPNIPARMEKMIAEFGAQGIVEARPGIVDDPDFPALLYVENLSEQQQLQFANAATHLRKLLSAAPPDSRLQQLHAAGWDSEQHLREAVNLRARRKS